MGQPVMHRRAVISQPVRKGMTKIGQPAKHRPRSHWPASEGGTWYDGPASEAQMSRPIGPPAKEGTVKMGDVGLPALIRKPIGQPVREELIIVGPLVGVLTTPVHSFTTTIL